MGELIDRVKGKVKQAEGRLTGNRGKEAEGVMDELKGKAKGAFEDLKADVKSASRERDAKDGQPGHLPRRLDR
jgi:uncharacterized protein YjbJ (UPF0337 family)